MQFNVVERMTRAPSRCIFCHRQDGPAIETGLQERLPFGQVYVCLTSCVPSFIELAGGLTAAERRAKGDELRDVEDRLAKATAELDRLRPFERAIMQARDSVGHAV